MKRDANTVIVQARELRRSMTLPEGLLWQVLRNRPAGFKFRRQHPLAPYVLDFYCAAAKLVIEVDGAAHDMGDRPERDVKRTKLLESKGYQVIRIAAADVLRDADETAQSIVSFAARPLHRADGAVPLPVN